MNKKQNLAIILARGGSTRIPKKNIVGFLGEPLIARMIRACQEAQIFDRILVATDDDDIIKVAGDYGVEVPFKREFFNNDAMHTDHDGNPIDEMTEIDKYYWEKLKKFKVPIAEYCLLRLQETVGESFDNFCILAANTPFVTAKAINDIYLEFVRSQKDYAMTVARCGKHPWLYMHGSPERPVALIPEVREKNGRKLALRTQELPELFLPCHPSFYRVHCPAEAIDYGYVFQDWEVSIDIDTYDDLKWCEKMARGFVHDAKRHDVFVNAEVNHFDSKRELYTKSSRM